MDWRSRVGGAAAEDFDRLVEGVLAKVGAALTRRGTPPPCSLAMSRSGELVDVGAQSWLGASSTPREVIADLYRIARAEAVARRAVAVAQVGRTSAGLALRIDLEHADGAAVSVVLPYTYSRLRRAHTAGAPALSSGSRNVWRDRPAEAEIDLRTPRSADEADEDVWLEDVAAG